MGSTHGHDTGFVTETGEVECFVLSRHPWGHSNGICTWSEVMMFSSIPLQSTEDDLMI